MAMKPNKKKPQKIAEIPEQRESSSDSAPESARSAKRRGTPLLQFKKAAPQKDEFAFEEGSKSILSSSFEIRQNEVEALQAIYLEEMELITPVSEQKRGEFKIRIAPNFDEQICFCWLVLKVQYKKNYPKRAPTIKLVDFFNLTPEQIRDVKSEIDSITRKCSQKRFEMIDEVC